MVSPSVRYERASQNSDWPYGLSRELTSWFDLCFVFRFPIIVKVELRRSGQYLFIKAREGSGCCSPSILALIASAMDRLSDRFFSLSDLCHDAERRRDVSTLERWG